MPDDSFGKKGQNKEIKVNRDQSMMAGMDYHKFHLMIKLKIIIWP